MEFGTWTIVQTSFILEIVHILYVCHAGCHFMYLGTLAPIWFMSCKLRVIWVECNNEYVYERSKTVHVVEKVF